MLPSRMAFRISTLCVSISDQQVEICQPTLPVNSVFVILDVDSVDSDIRIQVQSLLLQLDIFRKSSGRFHIAIMLQELQDQGLYEVCFAQSRLKPGDVSLFDLILDFSPLSLFPI